jgi:hypothetical protein
MQFDNQIASQTKSFKTDQAVGPGLDQAKVSALMPLHLPISA